MKGLVTAAALVAVVVVAMEAVLVLGLGWHPPSEALVFLPLATAFAAFLGAGRLRAVRRQKRRRAQPRLAYGRDLREPIMQDLDSREPDLVPVRADDEGYQR